MRAPSLMNSGDICSPNHGVRGRDAKCRAGAGCRRCRAGPETAKRRLLALPLRGTRCSAGRTRSSFCVPWERVHGVAAREHVEVASVGQDTGKGGHGRGGTGLTGLRGWPRDDKLGHRDAGSGGGDRVE